ncbi:MAG: response regulator transcription factor [Firmicutes bacterium]|nr:response regulator transcription factor [Bacillota bacterium]
MKILIVEDEYALADAIGQTLKNCNYSITICNDGLSGLNEALTGVYDCIVLDIMMPKMNGYQVIKELRSENIKTPILLLSAKSEVESKVYGLDIGADYYLTKPFATKELIATIRAITRRKEQIIESTLTFGDIELKMDQCELFCLANQQSIPISNKELQLLEMLISNKGRIVSKDTIFEKIWGYDSDAEYNSIEVYISFLRKKLSVIDSEVKIKSKRGLGYCMEYSHDS